jgi:hypothetical protein
MNRKIARLFGVQPVAAQPRWRTVNHLTHLDLCSVYRRGEKCCNSHRGQPFQSQVREEYAGVIEVSALGARDH